MCITILAYWLRDQHHNTWSSIQWVIFFTNLAIICVFWKAIPCMVIGMKTQPKTVVFWDVMLDMNLQVAMVCDTCTENGNGTMISLVAVKVRTWVYVQTQRSTIPPTQQNPNKRPPPKDFFCRLLTIRNLYRNSKITCNIVYVQVIFASC